ARFIKENTLSMTVLIRLLPLGNNAGVNIAAGVSGARSLPFFLGSALGYLPQTVIFALVGSGTGVNQYWQVAVAMLMFVVATLLGAMLYRKYRKGMSLGSHLDRELGIDKSAAVR
ncbi:MAG: VTT domain-containing protein, partial [Gammaproteobacteria bacterium]